MGQTERREALKSLDALFDIADAREPMWLEGASRQHYSNVRQALSVPDGYALVPTEPTKAMIEAGVLMDSMGDIYRAMIDEAPDPED